MAGTGTARAGDVRGFSQGWTQTLARQLQQAKPADFAGLNAGTVVMQGVTQTVFDFALIPGTFHVDEVDDDQTTEVAQTQLAGDFVSCFQVGLQCSLFDIAALGRATRVDVDRYQGFRMVDDDGATGRQVNLTSVGRFDLVFDLEAGEERDVVAIAFDAVNVVRHDLAHEGLGLLENIICIDENFTDVRLEVVADSTNDQAAFLENQQRRGVVFGYGVNGGPQLHQVVEIPLQLFSRTTNGSGTGDQTHAFRDGQLGHCVTQFRTVIPFDTARNTAATRIVWHEHQITTGQGDIGRQGSPLVATLIFVDLNDEFLTLFQGFLHFRAATFAIRCVVFAGDFLEGQEAMAVSTVVYEHGF